MINLHESMGPGWDRTRDPWICSQLRICNQTRYRLRYDKSCDWRGKCLTHKAPPIICSRQQFQAQLVTCIATDACLTADPGVTSSIPVRSHTFVEIDHEIISTVILLLPLIHSRRVVVSYKRKYVHELLVNRLFKPAQEKVCLGELTVPQ